MLIRKRSEPVLLNNDVEALQTYKLNRAKKLELETLKQRVADLEERMVKLENASRK